MLLPPELSFLLYSKTGLSLAADFKLEGIDDIDGSEFLNLRLASELALTVHQVVTDVAFLFKEFLVGAG